jgi:3-oxoacyl-[acyl-carrier protein] reductase
VVCVSSIGGVAGNFGQTNYATSKAALIGYVAARAAALAPSGITVNAIAPGFIETEMTDAMPFMPREIGRRLNSLKQGGRPRDVAELLTFLCTPGSSGISGQTIRVCGQALMGA